MNHDTLLDALYSVTTIPLIPFRGGKIDFDAHAKNISYLMKNNHLSENRPRVICIAGTSLIHHVDNEAQNKLIEVTGEVMGKEGVLISALPPNPISNAGKLVESQTKFTRVPDVFLVMPLGGVFSSQGLYEGLMAFGDQYGERTGARFLYYYRQPRDREHIARLICDSPHFVGVKVGTTESDVPHMLDKVGDHGIVIWGVGDRSTKAAQLGAKGHTSGISVLFAKAGDLLNNAQRSGKYEESLAIEKRITAIEELRFMNNREFNYTAVLEGMILSGFDDIDGGEGGPFNPRVSGEVSAQVQKAIENILDLH
jgi:dihydrodipicolinate synthase/N-acetylneuraminate lyase